MDGRNSAEGFSSDSTTGRSDMARVCDYCGKGTVSGGSIARRGLPKKKGGVGLNITGRSKRKFKPNIQRVRAVIDGETRRVKVCTRCLKSGVINKPVAQAQIAR